MTPPIDSPFKVVAGTDVEAREASFRMFVEAASILSGATPAPDPDDKSVFDVHPPLLASSSLLPKRQWVGGPEGFTPGTVSAFSGPPKSYKSTLALSYAISLAAGIEWAGIKPERSYRVLYAGWEDTLIEVQRRVHGFVERSLSSSLDTIARNMRVLPMMDPLMTSPSYAPIPAPNPGWDKFVRTVDAFNAEVLFVDTMSDLHDGDDSSNQVMRAIATPLRELAKRRNMVVVCITHDRKDTNGTSLQRLRGGGAFGGVIRRHIPVRPATPEQAKEMQVPEHVAANLIFAEAGSNQYGPASPTRWFLAGNHELGNHEFVAVLEEFDAPTAVSANPETINRLIAAIGLGYAGLPLSDHRNAGERSFYGACEAVGLSDRKSQDAMLRALKRDHGVVIARYAKARKSAADAPFGLRTRDGKPESVSWIT